MRNIKFRVWNIEYNIMFYPDKYHSLFFRQGGEEPDFWQMRIEKMPLKICDNKSGILMQYTGLKDKTGKEIYEGDILKSITLDNKEHFQDVYFKEGAFCLRTGFDTTLGVHLYKRRIIAHEVVGNIYENPELLDSESLNNV